MAVRPEGANHQWRKNPPRELSIDLVADERLDLHSTTSALFSLVSRAALGFAGLVLKGDMLGVDPRLPPQWRSLSFRVCWRGRSVAIGISGNTVQATLVEGEGMEMRIGAATRKLAPGATLPVSV